MSNQSDSKNRYNLPHNGEGGSVNISNEVIASIAKLATKETEGVNSMAGNIKNDIVGKFSMKNVTKGVKLALDGNKVIVDIAINVEYGYNIPKTCETVQDKVKQKLEQMTGLQVTSVNVRVAGVCDESEAYTGNV